MRRCKRMGRLLQKALVDPSKAATKIAAQWDHLGCCQTCRENYDNTMALLRTMHGLGPDEPTPLSLAISRERVLRGAQGSPSQAGEKQWALWRRPAFAVISLVLILGVVLWAVWYQRDPASDMDQWAVRGGAQEPSFSFRVICQFVDHKQHPVTRSISESPAPNELAACPPQGHYFFAYLSRRPGALYVLQQREKGPARMLLPNPEEKSKDVFSIGVAASLTKLPISLPASEPTTVWVVFAEKPLEVSTVVAELGLIPNDLKALGQKLQAEIQIIRLAPAIDAAE